jgi:hypothetical protein
MFFHAIQKYYRGDKKATNSSMKILGNLMIYYDIYGSWAHLCA